MKSEKAGLVLAMPVTAWFAFAFAVPFGVVILLSLHEFPDPFGPLIQAPSLAQFAVDLLRIRSITG